MKKILLFLSFLLMSIGVWGDVVAYTLTPASGSNNSYAGNCDIDVSGITWNLTGNSQQIPWRIGGKSLSNTDRALYSKTTIKDNVSKIVIEHGAASSITVNSMKVIVASDATFSNVISTLTPTFAASSKVTVERPDDKEWSNAYYKFVYNVTVSSNKNKFFEFVGAEFYLDAETIKHTVFWLANGDTIYSETSDARVDSVPHLNVNDYCGDICVGWTNSMYNSNEPPSMLFNYLEESPRITKDTTFYAVFSTYSTGHYGVYEKTKLSDLTNKDIFIIVCKNSDGYYAMSNNNGTSKAPSAVHIILRDNQIVSGSDSILWNISVNNEGGYTFYPNGSTTTWLYCTNNNNGVRVGTNENKLFVIVDGYLKNSGTSRYVGVYNSSDWRCYTSINEKNIKEQTFEYYKRIKNLTDFHTACIREFNASLTDSLWTTKENWTNGKLPTLKYTAQINKPVIVDTAHAVAKNIIINQNDGTGKIIIQPNKGLEVDSTIVVSKNNSYHSTTPNDLILESSEAGNASLIFNNNNNSQATVCLYSKAKIENGTWNWQYMGTAMTKLNALYNYYGSWIYRWDENDGWVALLNGGTMNAWTGYCITQENHGLYATTGTLIPTDTKDTTLSIKPNGYMVFANSWTAPIHIDKFNKEINFKLDTANVYLFNTGSAPDGSVAGTEAGTHVVIPINAAKYTGDSLIAPQQGFFVTTGDNAGLITLNYKTLVRTNGNADIVAGSMRSPKRNKDVNINPNVLKIFATGSLYKDKVIILEKEDFSEGFDNGWDGRKSSFGTMSPSIYVVNNNGTYDAVSAIPDYEGTVLGFKPGTDTAYSLSFEYNGDEILYLNDMVTLESTLIDNDSKYTFTSNESEEIRFIISSTPYSGITTGIDNIKTNSMKKFIINNNIYIIHNGLMFNILGQSIK